jgi:hypothetical protein
VYYHCSRYYQSWAKEPCSYKRFIPGTWEDMIWHDVRVLLRNDTWIEQQLLLEQSQDENTGKLIRVQQLKIAQSQARIAKVREGFDGGIYDLEEAKIRIAEYHDTMARAESEMQRLKERTGASTPGKDDMAAIKDELEKLRDRNLDEATFEDKLDIVSKLGIKVCPSEDLDSVRVLCQLNLRQPQTDYLNSEIEPNKSQNAKKCELATGCGKGHIGPP